MEGGMRGSGSAPPAHMNYFTLPKSTGSNDELGENRGNQNNKHPWFYWPYAWALTHTQ